MLTAAIDLVDALEQTWTSTAEVCRSLTDEEWELSTGCPGWTVKDNLSHLVGLELVMMGEAEPDHVAPEGLAHVKGPFGAYMETHVDVRRPVPGPEVLAEFEAMSAARIAALRGLDDAGFDAESPGPMGSRVALRRSLPTRVFDSFAHEQDIRRAVGRPGNLESPAGAHAREMILRGVARKLPELLGDATGCVLIDGGLLLVEEDGKGRLFDGKEHFGYLRVQLSTDRSNLIALGCGRSDADPDAVKIEGDEELGRRIVENFAVTP